MNLTPKQESFCQKYIEVGNASEAYRQSYNAGKMKTAVIHVKASELLASGNVSVRIEQLQAEHAERHAVTVDKLTIELDEARQKAIDNENPTAMISASMSKARLHGLLKNKVEVSHIDIAERLERANVIREKMMLDRNRSLNNEVETTRGNTAMLEEQVS